MTNTLTETLTDLYRLHVAGRLDQSDRRWLYIQETVYRITSETVSRRTRGLFGAPLERIIEEVQGLVLGKFIARKYNVDGYAIEPVLRATIGNEMASVLRKAQSVTPFSIGDSGGTLESRGESVDDDMFEHVRKKLRQPFRFAEAPHVREAVLAFLLTSWRFPPQSFVGSMGVPPALRRPVFNAAVFDINEAIHANVA